MQGKAVGGGVGMASATDYCFATENASVKLSELAIGIGPFVVGPPIKRKIGVSAFSHLTINATEWHAANWAKEKNASTIISSITVKTPSQEIMGVASTGSARGNLVSSGIKIIENAAIPGIPGVLLNESMKNGQNVIVLLVGSESNEPDLRATYNLCTGLSKLVQGITCNLSLLEKQAKQIEEEITQAETENRDLSESMYR